MTSPPVSKRDRHSLFGLVLRTHASCRMARGLRHRTELTWPMMNRFSQSTTAPGVILRCDSSSKGSSGAGEEPRPPPLPGGGVSGDVKGTEELSLEDALHVAGNDLQQASTSSRDACPTTRPHCASIVSQRMGKQMWICRIGETSLACASPVAYPDDDRRSRQGAGLFGRGKGAGKGPGIDRLSEGYSRSSWWKRRKIR